MSAPAETYEWAQSCSRELRHAEAGGQRFSRQGWAVGSAYWAGDEWRVPAVRPLVKRKRLKLDPNLVDGEHWTIVDTAEQATESLQMWLDEAVVGEAVTIEIVEMTDREVEELPDI